MTLQPRLSYSLLESWLCGQNPFPRSQPEAFLLQRDIGSRLLRVRFGLDDDASDQLYKKVLRAVFEGQDKM